MNRLVVLKMLLQIAVFVPFSRSIDIFIPWTSSSLKNNSVFVVLLGDDIIFHPCGDSDVSTLKYTNSKEVFEQCTPPDNIPSGVLYTEVGACGNPSGKLTVLVRTGIPGVNFVAFKNYETYFFLSDHESECQNGLKAVVIVSEIRPQIEGPTTTTSNTYSTGDTGSVSTDDGQSDADELVITLPLVPTVIALCLLGAIGALAVISLVTVTFCYRLKKRRTISQKKLEKESQMGSTSLMHSMQPSSVEKTDL